MWVMTHNMYGRLTLLVTKLLLVRLLLLVPPLLLLLLLLQVNRSPILHVRLRL